MKRAQPLLTYLLVSLVAAISVLTIAIFSNRQVNMPALPEPPLKDLGNKHQVEIGNYASLKLLGSQVYKNILTSQYDFMVVDGDLNWTFNRGSLRPSKDKFDFSAPDKVFAFASANNKPTQGHHFVWGEEKWLPSWLKDGNYSPQELLDLMQTHITEVGTYYKGRVREWTVVNEAFTRQQHIFGLKDWWADHIGSLDYIDKAFTWAHQADPNAKLILNDFNNEGINVISNATYDYVKGMKQRGVPIDGLGMQMHIDGTRPPKKEEVIANMKRFADLGIEVYVTEFDVNMADVKLPSKEKNIAEASIYYDMARACIESRVCHSFAFLGVTDKDSWYNELGLKDARPLAFDQDYKPKPAFHAVRKAFEDN